MDKPTNNSIDTISRTCIAVRLRLLNRVVTNFYDDALRPLGLKVSQLNILIVTARLGLARPAQVCKVLQLDASTLRAIGTEAFEARNDSGTMSRSAPGAWCSQLGPSRAKGVPN